MNMNNEPDYPDEDCISDGDLPTGSEKLPLTKEAEESCEGLKEFFFNAYNQF